MTSLEVTLCKRFYVGMRKNFGKKGGGIGGGWGEMSKKGELNINGGD